MLHTISRSSQLLPFGHLAIVDTMWKQIAALIPGKNKLEKFDWNKHPLLWTLANELIVLHHDLSTTNNKQQTANSKQQACLQWSLKEWFDCNLVLWALTLHGFSVTSGRQVLSHLENLIPFKVKKKKERKENNILNHYSKVEKK